jgi:hypothetical protein
LRCYQILCHKSDTLFGSFRNLAWSPNYYFTGPSLDDFSRKATFLA